MLLRLAAFRSRTPSRRTDLAFTLFKFLHILTMFIAVAATAVPEVVLHWVNRRTAVASADERLSPEVEVVMHDRRALMGSVVLMSSIVVIVFLMVVKPGR